MRLFIGIPLDESVKSDIINLYDNFKAAGKIKWVGRENLHVTVKFLGETFESAIENIKSAMDKSIVGIESFHITINKVLGFPSIKRAKVIWANVDKNAEIIEKIFMDLEDGLAGFGFAKEERKYIPHITMARVKDGMNISTISEKLSFEYKAKIEGLVLFKSDLKPQGAVHTKIHEAKLK